MIGVVVGMNQEYLHTTISQTKSLSQSQPEGRFQLINYAKPISLIPFIEFVCLLGGSGSVWAEDTLDPYNSGNDVTPVETRSSPEPDRELQKATPQPPYDSPQRGAVSFNFGLGLAFADLWPDNSTIGWDVLAGFEKTAPNGWDFGAQVHVLNGSLFDTSLHTMALFATVRPGNEWLRWLQFKAGVVDADYSDTSSVQQPPYYYYVNQTTTWSGTGEAVGVGIVVGEGSLRWHLLDIERYSVAGHSFNVYSISIAIIGNFH